MKAENLWRISGLALVALIFAAVAFVLTHQVQSWLVEAEKSAPVQGEVVYNNASAGTSVIDGYADTGVSNGTLEYVGDGWWHVKGWRLVYVKPPANYSIAVVHVKSRAEKFAQSVLLVLEARPHASMSGWTFFNGTYVFTLINGKGRGEVLYASGGYGKTDVGAATGFKESPPLMTPGVDKGWIAVISFEELFFKIEFKG